MKQSSTYDDLVCPPTNNYSNRSILKYAALAFLFFFSIQITYSQIAVTQNANTQSLAQLLAGQGVTISNYTKTCDNNGSGTFVNTNSNLGLTQGVVLASGRVQNIPQAANNFASTQFTNNGDAQLSTLTTGTIYDKCVLEFDIVPQGNQLQFQYVFASEEYPEFVCSPYNDVFGFFISGPKPGGGNYTNQDIATIPNTTTPVFINSVNPGISGTFNGNTWNSSNCTSLSNTSYYVNNQMPINPRIVYDGMTVVLTAQAAVTPCQVYHLKLAIADVGDRIYDSGVFLEAYSFTSSAVTVSASAQLNASGYTSAYEGCVGGTYTVSLSQPQATDDTISLLVSGTATNGVDYNNIPSWVVIPAGQTSATIAMNPLQDGVLEGAETVTVAVINPCSGVPSSSASLTIEDNLPGTININDSTLCPGQSAQLTLTGGFSYSWSPTAGLSNPNIANPIATPNNTTTYIGSINWGTCTQTLPITVHVSHPLLSLSASPGDTICNNSTATLSSVASGGVAPYIYVWSNAASTSSINVSTSGTYSLTITDSYGCTANAAKSLAISNLIATATPTNILCNGASTGSITTTATGGSAPYQYNWGSSIITQNRTNLVAGTYIETVTDGYGCSVSVSAVITQPAAVAPVTTVTNVLCRGGNTGTINVTVTGGTSPYTFNWGTVTTQNRTNLAAGNYSVTVTDANGCTGVANATVTEPAAALGATTATNSVSCFGGNNGAITLTASGGTAPYSYLWNDNITTQNRSNLSAGNYSVTITDAHACSTISSATINQPAAALNLTALPSNVSCYGGNNGSITLTAGNGTSPYTFLWNDNTTTQNRSNLAAGTYTVTGTDAHGCSATTTATVTQPSAALSATTTTNNISCFNGSDGSITLSVTWGTAPYGYIWNDNITTQNRTNLAAGNYSVTITDALGCSTIASAVLTQPAAALSAVPTANNVSCYNGSNGSISLAVSGGTPTYSFHWNDNVLTQNRTNLPSGTYTVTVTDAHLCTASASSVVLQPAAALSVTPTVSNVSCYNGNNGSINTTTAGGTTPYTYLWNDNATTQNRTNLASGTYIITTTDAHGCSATASATISQPVAALNATTSTGNVSCYNGANGSITLSVAGGTTTYGYLWSDNTTTQNRTNLAAGTYSVTITDAHGCSTVASATLTQPAAALSATPTINNASCYNSANGSISLAVSGGTVAYSFHWNDNIITQNRTNLASGNYSVTVTDAHSCTALASATISQPGAALSTTPTVNNVSCFNGNNGTINTATTGGTTPYTYLWNDNTTTQNCANLTSGTYTLTATDAHGCSATASATITQPAAALSTTASTGNVSCYNGSNGSITLSVSGGSTAYSYLWNDNAITQNRANLAAGTYSVTITDAHGCSTVATATLTQPTAALTAVPTPNNVSCYGGNNGSISLTVGGGTIPYAYHWNDNVTTDGRTNVANGAYSVTVTDAHACTTSATTTITQPLAALNVVPATSSVSCYSGNNGAINITTTGGTIPYGYLWSDNATDQNRANLPSGIYTVTATDAHGCSSTASATIAQPAAALNITPSTGSVSCYNGNNGTVNIIATGGTAPYGYLWNDNATTQNRTNLTSGTYSVTATDAHGCSTSANASVAQPAAAVSVTTTVTNARCFGSSTGSIQTTVSGGTANYTYHWNTNSTASSLANVPSGNYSVTVTDAHGCSTTTSASVQQPAAALQSSIAPTNVSCRNAADGSANLTVTGGTPGYTFNWGANIITQNRVNLAPGTYHVTITDNNLCTATNAVTITQPAALGSALAHTNVTCKGGSTGTITQTTSGGTAPYTYVWNDGDTAQNRTGLAAGTYTVTITDAHSCTAPASVNIAQPLALAASTAIANVSCNGGHNGNINLTVSGGTPPYFYVWDGGTITQDISNLGAGTYTVAIHDLNNCPDTITAIVTEPAPIILSTTHTDVSCFSGSNGTITLNVTGGTPNYTYNWGQNIYVHNRTNLTEGLYAVTVTDAHACSASTTEQVSQPASAININSEINNVLCRGGNSGLIDITVAGGTSPYTYNWGNNIVTEDRSNLVAGNYRVTVTDAHGCTALGLPVITQPAAALSYSVATTNVSCNGGTNGAIALNAAGGTSPYGFVWSNNATTQSISNIGAGTYSVTITDNNLCSISANVNIQQPLSSLAASILTTDVSCYGGGNGTMHLTASGGTAPYGYMWNDSVTTQNRANLSAGTYTALVTDAHGCSTTATATISQPAAALSVASAVTNLACFNNHSGAINLNVSGGTSPYTYYWTGNITTQNRTNLVAGTYHVTVSDAHHCTAIDNPVVTQPAAALSGTASVVNASCFGSSNGGVNLIVTGGTAPYGYLWSNNATTQNLQSQPAGNYTVTITDGNLCSATATAHIGQPVAALNSTITTNNVSCYGGNNGFAHIVASGGTAPYGYLWNNNSHAQNLDNLMAGNYAVTVTDSHGCTATATITIAQPVAALSITDSVNNVACFGSHNGSINLNVSGGTTPYTYNWAGNINTQNRSNLYAGTYHVTVTDAHNCTAIDNPVVTQPAVALSIHPSVSAVGCYGGTTGSVNMSVSGGTAPYGYLWNTNATTQNLNNAPSGSYTITVTDGHQCTATASAVISQPSNPLNATAQVNNVACFGNNTGSVRISTTGGTAPYGYLWNDNTTTQNRNNLLAGTYSVTITDAHGCSFVSSSTITQPTAALSVSATANNVACFGQNTGSVNLSVAGGSTPYTYNWGGNIITQNRNNLTAGTYHVTITDAHGCLTTATPVITQPIAAIHASATPSQISCYGNNSGAVNLNVTGGTTPYNFTWSNNATTQNLSGLGTGTYNVTITDANQCTAVAGASITQPSAALNATAQATDIACFGNHTGSVSLIVTGGTMPYGYMWNDNATTQNRANLAAGLYSVTITDAHGCSFVSSSTLIEPGAALNTNTVTNNVGCYGQNTGSVSLVVTGGTAPYGYLWSNSSTTQNQNNVQAGNYHVTVTDAHGCTAVANANITQPSAALSASVSSNNVSCHNGNNGNVNLVMNGGTAPYGYLWNNNSTTQSLQNIPAGTYAVTITDANSCTATANASITQPSASLTVSISSTNINCYGGNTGAASIVTSGGTAPMGYLWSNNGTTQNLSQLTAGNYSVTVTDANGCTTSTSTTVTQPGAGLNVNLTGDNVKCFGGHTGSITPNTNGGTGPYSYNWSNNMTTPGQVNLPSGYYQVTVTDAHHCTAVANTNIIEPALLTITGHPDNVTCYGGSNGKINISVSGGTTPYAYHWNNNNSTPSNLYLPAGQYAVTVQDAHNCLASDSFNVAQPSQMQLAGYATNVHCNGDSTGAVHTIVTGGSSGYHYIWSTTDTTANILNVPASSYEVTVTDANACSGTLTRTITQPSPININATYTNEPCRGYHEGSIDITATGGAGNYQYSWSNASASEDQFGIAAGFYTVTVTDAIGCTTAKTIMISQPAAITLTETHIAPLCNGSKDGSITISTEGGTPYFQFVWGDGTTGNVHNNLAAGTYTVTAVDANGCSNSIAAIIVSEPTAMDANTSTTDVACANGSTGSVDLTPVGGTAPYTYHWSNNSTFEDLAHAPAGNYEVTITDAHGCVFTSAATIVQLPPVGAIGLPDQLPCANAEGGIQLIANSGTPPYTFHWSNGANTEDLSNVHPGIYHVTVQDANGCTFDTTFTIVNLNTFTVTASGGGTVTLGESVELHATSTGSNQTTYTWTPATGLSCVECANTVSRPGQYTLYTVIGIDSNGCKAEDTVSVDVIQDHTFFTPNAFTPNGDGNNDFFQLYGNLAGIAKIDVMIFDRWGEKVFEAEEPTFQWDGIYRGQPLPPGVYVYSIKITHLDGKSGPIHKGSITLMR